MLYTGVCTSKVDNVEDKYYLVIITPDNKEIQFQTSSEEAAIEWSNSFQVRPIQSEIFFSPLWALKERESQAHRMNYIPVITFSCFLNIFNRISCADCGIVGECKFISRQMGLFLCTDCSSSHTKMLGRRISKIINIDELKDVKALWPMLYLDCNNHFNLLWEGTYFPPFLSLFPPSFPFLSFISSLPSSSFPLLSSSPFPFPSSPFSPSSPPFPLSFLSFLSFLPFLHPLYLYFQFILSPPPFHLPSPPYHSHL